MSQNSKWAAWQQLVLDQVDELVENLFESKPKVEVPEQEINPMETLDLHPITEDETGLEFNETPYVDTVEDRQIPDKSTIKPKKGAKV